MVANVITYRARSVLQDVGKAFGLTQAQVNGLTKYLDTRRPEAIPEFVDLPSGLSGRLILDACRRLDGFPRHLGIHSGGMVIADRPLWEVVPLEWGRMEDRSVLQWDKDDCASMGIVKFDLLGLGMLNALHLAVDTVEEVHGVRLDLAAIPQEPAHLPDAHPGRHRRSVPGGVAGADGHPASDEAEDLLRPGHRGGAHPPRAHPGPLGAPLPAPPQRRGGGALPPPAGRAHPGQDPGGAGVPGAVDGTGPGVRRLHPRPVRPPPPGDDPQALRRGDGQAAGRDLRRHGAATGSPGRRPTRSGRSCRGSPPSVSRRATRCPSPTSSTCRPGCGTTGPPSTWPACSTPSPWASTAPTRWWQTPGATGWWCCRPT